ncbi:MAG TPA: glycosyltransferase family 2 protein [Nitrospiraceae bacterium]|nr:glycosyltransferase family 2 protein [Nitrospiraceae bacterium]
MTDRSRDRRISPINQQMPRISVIVPVYNGGEPFRRCLAALAQAAPRPRAVVVVADGDTDGSRQVAAEFGARVITRCIAGGPAVARNVGARAVRGDDILLFLDADVAIKPGTLAKAASTFEDDPSVDAVIGSYDDAPPAANFHSQFKNLFHHYTHQTAREEASTFWAACGAIKHEVFRKMGGFDERYRYPSIEDIELGYRLTRAGHRIRLSKTLQVTHLKRWRLGSMLKADFFYRALPWTELIHRDRRMANDLNLAYSGRLSVLLVYALLITSMMAVWRPHVIGVAGGAALGLLALNASVYRFFFRKRGFWFTLQTIPWHWFYYFYSGLAFAIGTARHFIMQTFRSFPAERQTSAGHHSIASSTAGHPPTERKGEPFTL